MSPYFVGDLVGSFFTFSLVCLILRRWRKENDMPIKVFAVILPLRIVGASPSPMSMDSLFILIVCCAVWCAIVRALNRKPQVAAAEKT